MCIAVDLTPPPQAHLPMVQADLCELPFRTESFDVVSAMNCLSFLGDPTVGIREAHRLLKPGGLFLAGAPSRYHDAELRYVVPDWGTPSPFDAEEAEIVGSAFEGVEVDWWEIPAYRLADRAAVEDYLTAFKIPEAAERAHHVDITKAGVNILGSEVEMCCSDSLPIHAQLCPAIDRLTYALRSVASWLSISSRWCSASWSAWAATQRSVLVAGLGQG